METKGVDVHCFIDNREVPLKECDLENQNSKHTDSKDGVSDPMIEEVHQPNKIPNGSSIVSIIIKEGSIVEKVFKTPEGQKISLKASDLKSKVD